MTVIEVENRWAGNAFALITGCLRPPDEVSEFCLQGIVVAQSVVAIPFKYFQDQRIHTQ
jgi:hypothetical protein